jgi:hypothetical protein
MPEKPKPQAQQIAEMQAKLQPRTQSAEDRAKAREDMAKRLQQRKRH